MDAALTSLRCQIFRTREQPGKLSNLLSLLARCRQNRCIRGVVSNCNPGLGCHEGLRRSTGYRHALVFCGATVPDLPIPTSKQYGRTPARNEGPKPGRGTAEITANVTLSLGELLRSGRASVQSPRGARSL